LSFIFFLSTPDILPQSKDKTTNWPEPVFERYSVEDGFSPSNVFSIIQDSRGFMWFGAENGLTRYDGYNFKTFKHDPDDERTLSDNCILSICEDNTGALWLGTMYGGLNKYDSEKDIFYHYISPSNDSADFFTNTVSSVFKDKSGNLWIGTTGGLNKLIPGDYEKSQPAFTRYMHIPDNPKSLSSNLITIIYEDKSGNLWIGTYDGGLNKLIPGESERSEPTFIRYMPNPANPKSLSNMIVSIYEDKSGTLWIGTWGGGLNKFDREKEIFTYYKHDENDPSSLSNDIIGSIYEDSFETLWIGTVGGGLNRFDRINEKFEHYLSNPNDDNSLSGNMVQSISEDSSGILWIGTNANSITKLNLRRKKFKNYTLNAASQTNKNLYQVRSVCEDRNGNLWIGTYSLGLYKLAPDSDINPSTSIINYMNDPDNSKSLSANAVSSILEDKRGNLWFGIPGELIGTPSGLNKLTPGEDGNSKPEFIHYEANLDHSILTIYEDQQGNLWIGTFEGLIKIIPGTNESIADTSIFFKHNPDDPASLSDNFILSIFQDKKGIIWVATASGLNKLNSSDSKFPDNSFIRYTNEPGNPASISDNMVYSIHEDDSGNLWIGTNLGGLNKFDRENEVFIRYTEKDGLSNNSVLGILEDSKGNLWLRTGDGLSKFIPKIEKFINFTLKDGLQNTEFRFGAQFINKKGKMYFGGANVITSFYPEDIKENIHVPPIVITDFRLFNNSVVVGLDTATNRTILTKSITETNEIELTYKDYIISFEFAALDFHTPEKNQYAYFLEGFDKEWIYTDASKRFATYTNLDPGEYTFKVKGSNNDGIWNEAGTSIKLIITPPWWSTWWAYSLYVLLGLAALYSIRRYELNRSQLKNQVKLDEVKLKEREETDKMKSRFFANISHEFRTPLTLILGPAEYINKDSSGEEIEKQTNVIKRNAKRLLGLINQLLDLSKLEAGKLELKASKTNIVPFIKGLIMSFESVAERKDITLKVKAEKDEIELYFDKEKMTKIMTNLLSNAFKFTNDGGEITVALTLIPSPQGRGMSNLSDVALAKAEGQGEGKVQITVKDTGIGISEEELPKLFDRFYQVDSSQTREHEGTGIGLALTKELVELHHGTISADSKFGSWTEFTVTLPMGRNHLNDEEIVEVEVQDNVILTPLERGKNLQEINETDSSHFDRLSVTDNASEDKNLILVVEDNADVREFIKDSLGNEFQIEEASNGEQGVRKAEQIIPDLIISDIMMPKMDGNELTRILKNDEKTSHIPIILLTAKSEQESKLEGLETGADDYLTKPFDTKELR
jgi:signal transduction histidine kinase/ligand-binding sensor domain-containing protein/CheY-like chemotaxis protein